MDPSTEAGIDAETSATITMQQTTHDRTTSVESADPARTMPVTDRTIPIHVSERADRERTGRDDRPVTDSDTRRRTPSTRSGR
jgi:hypothetical protein